MVCRANLGTGRVTGEVIKRNSQTVVMRLIGTAPHEHNVVYAPPGKKGKPIKRHIEKHRVVFEGDS